MINCFKLFSLILFIFMFSGCSFLSNQEIPVKKDDFSVNQKTEIEKIENIFYSEDCDECRLDIYRKNDDMENKPIIFFVHGGGWKIGDKSRHSKKGEFFAKEDFLFIAIEYPLFPKAGYEEQAKKVAKAIKWTHENAEKYYGDKNNIILMGHSAGGHLVSLISTDESYLRFVGLELKDIKETILLDSAGLDINQIKEEAPIIFNQIYKPIFGDIPKELKSASPISYIQKNKNIPPFLIFYSSTNKSTSANAVKFNEALAADNIRSIIYEIDSSHSEINENIGEQDDQVTNIIINHFNN